MNLLFMANNGLPRNGLVALYDMGKQIALGNTGQTLVDFSGRGNNAQLGSTAGADTNDPAYSGQGLTFGTDDYVKSSASVFDDMAQFTCITVCKALGAGGGGYGRILDKTARKVYLNTSQYVAFEQSVGTGSNIWRSNSTVTWSNPVVVALSYNGITPSVQPKMWLNGSAQGVTVASASGGTIVSDASADLYVANSPDAARYFNGTIYMQAWYNRILSDTEYMQAYNYLRRLMNSRGITI